MAAELLPTHAVADEYKTDRGSDGLKRDIRDFALYSYSYLCNDIINGTGPYLDTLYSLLRIPQDGTMKAHEYLVEILVQQKTISAFAVEVANIDIADLREEPSNR